MLLARALALRGHVKALSAEKVVTDSHVAEVPQPVLGCSLGPD